MHLLALKLRRLSRLSGNFCLSARPHEFARASDFNLHLLAYQNSYRLNDLARQASSSSLLGRPPACSYGVPLKSLIAWPHARIKNRAALLLACLAPD